MLLVASAAYAVGSENLPRIVQPGRSSSTSATYSCMHAVWSFPSSHLHASSWTRLNGSTDASVLDSLAAGQSPFPICWSRPQSLTLE